MKSIGNSRRILVVNINDLDKLDAIACSESMDEFRQQLSNYNLNGGNLSSCSRRKLAVTPRRSLKGVRTDLSPALYETFVAHNYNNNNNNNNNNIGSEEELSARLNADIIISGENRSSSLLATVKENENDAVGTFENNISVCDLKFVEVGVDIEQPIELSPPTSNMNESINTGADYINDSNNHTYSTDNRYPMISFEGKIDKENISPSKADVNTEVKEEEEELTTIIEVIDLNDDELGKDGNQESTAGSNEENNNNNNNNNSNSNNNKTLDARRLYLPVFAVHNTITLSNAFKALK